MRSLLVGANDIFLEVWVMFGQEPGPDQTTSRRVDILQANPPEPNDLCLMEQPLYFQKQGELLMGRTSPGPMTPLTYPLEKNSKDNQERTLR